MEPFVNMTEINRYMKFLGYQHCISKKNGQICLFWKGNHQTMIVANTDQQITIKKFYSPANYDLYVTIVYAKCTSGERHELWTDLNKVHNTIPGPWYIGGDFNVILDPEEKMGGKTHKMRDSLDFSSFMDACEVVDLGFTGPKFTWCNNRKPRKRI
ncbi:hypothetical protein KY290_034120 [Solanum tuberosum]|uniref:Uncharacterized protein n=1 Tax=Solanum tuberosum TaxID=4113 RepID=A0ABQ7U4A4_SOLTU|nr:hypothetical protein KY289_033513 [Solanum tuberosum]KAH0741077.1 hypothetical protein KY290_034120 [Solanum tuberosum]